MSECLFCKIIINEIPSYKIFENNNMMIILDAFPMSKGHFLIITKNHYEKMDEIPDDILKDIILNAKKYIKIFKSKLNMTDYNFVVNNGGYSGQAIPHAHFHIVPRSENDNVIKYKQGEKQVEEYYKNILQKINN